jgi:hypothetical protein
VEYNLSEAILLGEMSGVSNVHLSPYFVQIMVTKMTNDKWGFYHE